MHERPDTILAKAAVAATGSHTIYKYQIPDHQMSDRVRIDMPRNAKPLSVGVSEGEIAIWSTLSGQLSSSTYLCGMSLIWASQELLRTSN